LRDTNSKSTTRNPKIILLRHFIHLAYKGTNYHGWQSQPNAISVQEVLEKALQIILRKSIAIVAAGRTDAGVHAKEMYAHFDFDEIINVEKLVKKLNSFLPKDIAIFKIIKVHDTAHARFDAVKRTYQYHIHTQKNAFECNDSWYFAQNINIEKMNEACKILFAYTDFECFSKMKAKAFDTSLFKRILKYTKPYQWRFNGVLWLFAISLSVFAALRPYLLKQTVDGYIKPMMHKDYCFMLL
jgi:tRNA pseudouridine38-40 synthase